MQVTPPALRQARDRLAQVKRELSIKAETCERYEKELQRLKRSGASTAQIEPIEKTLEMEVKLYMRQLEQIGRPAAKAYAEALRAQARNENMPLGGLLKEFVGLFSQSQASGLTSAMGSQAQINQFVEQVCQRALAETRGHHSGKPFVNLQNAHLLAEGLGAEGVPSNKKIVEIFNKSARESQGL